MKKDIKSLKRKLSDNFNQPYVEKLGEISIKVWKKNWIRYISKKVWSERERIRRVGVKIQ